MGSKMRGGERETSHTVHWFCCDHREAAVVAREAAVVARGGGSYDSGWASASLVWGVLGCVRAVLGPVAMLASETNVLISARAWIGALAHVPGSADSQQVFWPH